MAPKSGADAPMGKDEYGEAFEDYGFIKRAEECKARGNEAFKKERYDKAMRDYDAALDQLLTVVYDKSITLGKKKWNDVVIMRSGLHLNKSTCCYRLKNFPRAVEEALECLIGNTREEMVKSSGKDGFAVESRLPKATRAKAWYRLSQCYANMDYIEKAKDALKKATECAEGKELLDEIAQQSLKIDIMNKQQKDTQRKQFRGFWDKLQERGGYADKAPRKAPEWDTIDYADKFDLAEEEDDFEYDAAALEAPGVYHSVEEAQAALEANQAEFIRTLPPGMSPEEMLTRMTKVKSKAIDHSFQKYLEGKEDQEDIIEFVDLAGRPVANPADKLGVPKLGREGAPARPKRKEEAKIAWKAMEGKSLERFEKRVAYRRRAQKEVPEKVWAGREQVAEQLEAEWRYQYEKEKLEKQQQRSAERMERLEQRAALEALDDSDGD